jgi:prepilin-type N-terminal cleavage/methylation domain-containing protein
VVVTEALPRPPRGRAGFALAEVLVAMVILAFGLMAVQSMALGASQMIRKADLTTQYTLVGSHRLEELLTSARIGTPPSGTGTQSLADGTIVDWTVTTTNAGTSGATLYRVRVTVTPASTLAARVRLDPITLTGQAVRG